MTADRLSFKERYSRVSNYLRPIVDACQVKPVSAAVFGGQLNFSHMKWWEMIFVVLILQAKAGDRRNWNTIRSWGGSLPELFDTPSSGWDKRSTLKVILRLIILSPACALD